MIESKQSLESGAFSKNEGDLNGDVPNFDEQDVDVHIDSPEKADEIGGNGIPEFDEDEGTTEKDMSSDECLDITDSGENRGKEQSDKDGLEKSEIGELKDQYIEELLDYSDCPETIDTDKFKNAELEKVDPQENAKRREEFNEKKKDLIKEWETENGREWPRYEEDVYSDSGKLIRKAGQPYDAHHIQPLSMGGKNTADNITPLHAQDHYDRQGVHSFGSAYSKLETKLEQKGC